MKSFLPEPRKTSLGVFLLNLLIAGAVTPLYAFPDYVDFIGIKSGRETNCALCHINPEGPAGLGIGQMGRLDSLQQNKLARARAAMAAGFDVESPILNSFGNSIIKTMGRRKFLDLWQDALLRKDPLVLEQITKSLDPKSDLDGDGIPDVRELLDGTHVLSKNHGSPGRLFMVNAKRSAVHLVAILAGLGLVIFGLRRLLRSRSFSGL